MVRESSVWIIEFQKVRIKSKQLKIISRFYFNLHLIRTGDHLELTWKFS